MGGKSGQSKAWTSREKSISKWRQQPAVASVATCHLRQGERNGCRVGKVVSSNEVTGTIVWSYGDRETEAGWSVMRREGELGSIFSKHRRCFQGS